MCHVGGELREGERVVDELAVGRRPLGDRRAELDAGHDQAEQQDEVGDAQHHERPRGRRGRAGSCQWCAASIQAATPATSQPSQNWKRLGLLTSASTPKVSRPTTQKKRRNAVICLASTRARGAG